MEGLEFYIEKYGIPLLTALIVLFIGLFLIKWVVKFLEKTLIKRELDQSLIKFVTNLSLWVLRILLIVTVAGMVGIPMTSFVAIIGAAGLAIGLALQGTLSNFAGGVLLMVFKPYSIGDLVTIQGETGVVKEILIFNTILLSPENKTIYIPNGAIMNGNITNFTREGKIRVDLKIGIAYDADIKQAKQILLDLINANDKVLKTPAATVNVGELADSAVVLEVRPFVKPEHYWDVFFNTLEDAKIKLDEAGVGIPFPQMDVTIKK